MKKLSKNLQNIEITIGKRIAHARIALGISRADLAKSAGISHQQLTKYETGVNRISISRLSLIAKKLEKRINYFYSDLVEPIVSDDENHSPIFLRLVKQLSKLKNQQQQKALCILVDGLLGK